METILKVCTRCNEIKNISDFYRAKYNKDGLQSFCKKCDNLRKTLFLRKKSKKQNKKDKQPTLIAKELLVNGLKRCPTCKEIKNIESFYKSRAQVDGIASHCILCTVNIQKKLRLNKKYKKYYNKSVHRNKILKTKFGISIEDYNRMLIAQNNVCAICGNKEKNKSLAVDHCHKTNKIRQLLCSSCNPTIGFLKEDPNLARKLAEYLERHKNNG